MTIRSLLLVAVLMPAAASATGDPRIRRTAYDPKAVTALHGCAGFQSTIAFADGERIENIALGNAALWQAVPNKRSDLLFLKPVLRNGSTNMTVVTDRHRYSFDLMARDDAACRAGRVTYDLQFTYPDEPAPLTLATAAPPIPPPPIPSPDGDLPAPAARNTAYSFTGTAANVPMRAFDDGHSTWLHWAEGVTAPAIYSLGPDKGETLLNYTIKGDYMVVDGVSPAFVLRSGKAVAILYNDAYQPPKLDADAPQPRASEKHSHRKHSLVARASPPAPVVKTAAETQEAAQ
jgi:type IV secretion system protein VirB9